MIHGEFYVNIVDIPSGMGDTARMRGFRFKGPRSNLATEIAMPHQPYDSRDGYIWMDGKLIKWEGAKVHVLTHALHYASSVFEGERAYGGRIFESRRHSERLRQSASLIDFEIPWSVDQLEEAKAEVMEANGLTDAYVRAVSWRGVGGEMGVAARQNPIQTAIAAWEWGAYYETATGEGAKLDISKWKRPSPETIPCEAKAAGLYMICTMSKHAAESKGCQESLMLDYRGYVAEATGANIFFVRDGEVHTPKPDCFLNGITRQSVVTLLERHQIKVHERAITLDELEGFEQCWLTGTAAEVTPVSSIGDYSFEVGDIACRMRDAYRDLVHA